MDCQSALVYKLNEANTGSSGSGLALDSGLAFVFSLKHLGMRKLPSDSTWIEEQWEQSQIVTSYN